MIPEISVGVRERGSVALDEIRRAERSRVGEVVPVGAIRARRDCHDADIAAEISVALFQDEAVLGGRNDLVVQADDAQQRDLRRRDRLE